jgi:hypothetical protein
VSREKLAQDVEDWKIAVDEGVRAGMVRHERKGGEHHSACLISVSISDREIRWIFGVHIKPVIGNRELGQGIVDAVFGRLWQPGRFGWGTGFHFP